MSEQPAEALTLADAEILEFARSTWKYRGIHDDQVLTRFGMTPARYYQRLNHLIGLDRAAEYDPTNVRRLRDIAATLKRIRTKGATS